MPRAYGISFDEKQMAKLRKKLGPDLVIPPTKTLIAAAAQFADREAVRRAPSVLRSNIAKDVSDFSARVVSDHPGARAMEAGRKPLVAGGTFPPPDAFLRLAGGDRGIAFAIARAVARRGTKGRFFFNKARNATNRELPTLIQKAADAIAQRWAS